MAFDQRYCLECGERRSTPSEFLLSGPPAAGGGSRELPSTTALTPPGVSGPPAGEGGAQRSSTLTVIAGVGVLLLAMGVGVLIGRSGSGKQSQAPAQVISVASAPSAAGSAATAAEPSFSGDWPAGTSGFTVELQTLPQTGTALSTVEAAKSAASAKGAKGVGALKSEEFTSLAPGSYVIYAGVEHKRAEAEKALASLKKQFPGAKVIRVANGASTQGPASSSSTKAPATGAGSSESHPAPPTVLESLKNAKGKNYEEKSKALPDVVSTG